jgi:hypothetical protein
MSIPDETLMAFADGTLPEAEVERIAAAMDADPALAERVALLADGRRFAIQAFRDVLDQPVPARLLAAATAPAVAMLPAARPANDNRRAPWRIAAFAAAASLVVGAFLGTWLKGDGTAPGLLPPRVAAALDQGRGDGTTTVAGTHLVDGGIYCRRFAMPDGTGTLQGLACREPDGWRLRVAVARTTTAGTFQPASGDDPVIADMLERLGAGPALDAATEAQAQQRGWRSR